MKKWIIITTAISSLVITFLLVALNYLGYLSTLQLFLILGLLILIIIFVVIISVVIRRRENKKDEDLSFKQQISRIEAKKLAIEMIKKEYTDHLSQYSSDEILNIGQSQHNRTPIYHLAGVGQLSKDRYDILIRLDDPSNKSTILVNSKYNEVREKAESLSASPPQYDRTIVRQTNPFGQTVESEKISMSPEVIERRQERAEQELRDAEVKE